MDFRITAFYRAWLERLAPGLLRHVIVAGFALFHAAPLTARDSPLPSLESFFAESARFAERLSPDGKQVAYLGPDNQQINRLWVVGMDRPTISIRVSWIDGAAVSAFFWIGNDSLLWQATDPAGRQRLFLGDSHGVASRELLPDEKRVISLEGVIDSSDPCILVGLADGPNAFPDLYRADLKGNAGPTLACTNRHQILTWAWNEAGTPVAGLRWTESGAKEILNLRDGSGAVIFRTEPADDARLLFATATGSRVMILTDRDADFTHLESIELATGKREKFATDPLGRVDVDQVVADARTGTILAAGYSDASIRWQALDPAFGEMLEAVNDGPDASNMTCLGFDAARKHFLLKRYSDRDPGTVFLYDVETRGIRTLWRERPEMDRATLCETKACDYSARDGSRIPAYLTVPRDSKPPWPLVVFPHGGPMMRTSPGFDGRVQFLASRGYAVLQPNFRGSRGYGKSFMNAGDGQWGKGVMQTDVTDGVDHLVRTGTVAARRVAILGGSYGGYAALAGLAFTPDRYAAGVCLFGISDLMDHATHSPVEWQAYAGDTARRLGHPDTAAGRVALDDRSPVNHAAAFQAPLLIYHGARDNLIPVRHARRMVDALERNGKPVDYLLAAGEAHGFSRPESEMAVYRAIEIFLHEHLGGNVGPAPAGPIARRLAELRSAARSDARR
jgi:dipeptidyl aminopeptidase/acylaminoacyl peptidase